MKIRLDVIEGPGFKENISAILEAALMTCMKPGVFPQFAAMGQEMAMEEGSGIPPIPEIAEWFGKLTPDVLYHICEGLLEGNHDEPEEDFTPEMREDGT